MRVQYYAHVRYYNPGIYSYEYITYMENIDEFTNDIFSIIKSNYGEIYGTEELNIIDLNMWSDFLDKNNIEYVYDDFFPYTAIWNYIKTNIENILIIKKLRIINMMYLWMLFKHI